MSHIFISYSHKDKDYVHKLQVSMVEAGLDAWIDDRLDYGSRWPHEIEKRLRACSAFVLVMSPHSSESEWVQNELNLARELKKPIFPLLLDGEKWWHVGTRQVVDVTGGKLPPEKFYQNLLKLLPHGEMPETPKSDAISVQVNAPVTGNIIVGNSGDVKASVNKPAPAPRAKKAEPKPEIPAPQPETGQTGQPDNRKTEFKLPKLDTNVIVAIIGGIVTIIAAMLGSEPFFKWLQAAPVPTTTPTVTLTLTTAPTFTQPVTVAPSLTPALAFTPTPELPPTATPLPAETTDAKGVIMRLVPAGAFMMGNDADDALKECQKYRTDCSRDWFTREEPPHQVTMDAFYMDVYEVTNARYKACVDAGGCTAPGLSNSYTRDSYYGDAQYADYPVIYVEWNQATAYCEWRGARLPSEAEWEKAARGGLEGKQYPWGDEAPVCDKNASNGAKFDDDAGCNDTDTEAVGSYAPNGYGLYDMAGNVWEWVDDWYDAYPGNTVADSSFGKTYRVLRGGSWYNSPYNLRVSFRFRYTPDGWLSVNGIRCAR